jgi:trimethylamine---corrinoid protein Co-methyltransferase
VKRNPYAGHPRSGGLSMSVFTDAELDDIHFATLELLERTGVFVEDDEALDIFADGGCRVDRETRMVRIPPHVVEEAIRSSPAKIVLGARDPQNALVLEPGRVSFCNFDEGIMVNDLRTGEHREPLLQDVAEIARLVDALDHIDAYEPAGSPTDRPQETAVLHGTEAALLNTTKNVGTESTSAWEVRKVIEMAAAVVGGEDALRENPIVGFGCCPVSPLKLPRDATEVIVETARHGLPCGVLSMAMSGGSSPVTLAGTFVQHNAEVLAGITLSQLTERGAPVDYGSSTTAMDLRLAAASVGSPELALFSAATAQMARRYLIPSFVAGL